MTHLLLTSDMGPSSDKHLRRGGTGMLVWMEFNLVVFFVSLRTRLVAHDDAWSIQGAKCGPFGCLGQHQIPTYIFINLFSACMQRSAQISGFSRAKLRTNKKGKSCTGQKWSKIACTFVRFVAPIYHRLAHHKISCQQLHYWDLPPSKHLHQRASTGWCGRWQQAVFLHFFELFSTLSTPLMAMSTSKTLELVAKIF
jgi:hypothetical protein